MAIGTTAAIVGSSLAGAALSSSAAKKATKAQTAAANADIAFQKETRDLIRGDLADYRTGGNNALEAYLYEMGLGPKPTYGGQPLTVEEFTDSATGGWGGLMSTQGGPTRYRVNGQVFNTREEADAYAQANGTPGTEYRGFEATPGYQFQLEQGQDSINALAGARGGLFSGRTLQDLSTFNQGMAKQEYGNYLTRLRDASGMGMNAAAMSGDASQNAAANIGNAYGNIGNAQSAGAIAQGNAWTGAMNNLAGAFQYQNALAKPQGPWWLG